MLGVLLAQTTDVTGAAAAATTTAAAGVMFGVWAVVIGISVIGLIIWIWALVDLLKRQFDNPNDRTTWLIVLIVGLVIGLAWLAGIIYLIAGRKKGTVPGQGGGAPSAGGTPPQGGTQ